MAESEESGLELQDSLEKSDSESSFEVIEDPKGHSVSRSFNNLDYFLLKSLLKILRPSSYSKKPAKNQPQQISGYAS